MNRYTRFDSIELIGIQVWFHSLHITVLPHDPPDVSKGFPGYFGRNGTRQIVASVIVSEDPGSSHDSQRLFLVFRRDLPGVKVDMKNRNQRRI